VYHFSPACNLTRQENAGVLRAEGKLLHPWGFGWRARLDRARAVQYELYRLALIIMGCQSEVPENLPHALPLSNESGNATGQKSRVDC
jgi:hypothetical protein